MRTAASAVGLNQSLRRVDPATLVHALSQVVGSPVPAVVFTSLATRCVPLLSDRCRIVIEEDGRGGYRIEWPLAAASSRPHSPAGQHLSSLGGRHLSWPARSGQSVTDNAVRTPFVGLPSEGNHGYRGIMVHLWTTGYRPTPTDAAFAQLAVSQAVGLVHQERLAACVDHQRRQITHLQHEVRTATGDVGAAIGILMTSTPPDPAQSW